METDKQLVLIVLAVSLTATTLLFFAGISQELLSFLIIGLMGAFILALRGHLLFAGWIGPLAALFIFGLLMFKNYGIRDTAMLGLPVTIIAGSLMNGRKGIIVFGLASLMVIAGLGVLEFTGLHHTPYSAQNSLADYIVIIIVIFLTIAIQWTVLSRLNEKHRQAERELIERKKAQEKLRYSENLYRRAIDAAGAVPYFRDFRTNSYSFIGEGIEQITGYAAAEMTPDIWDSLEIEGFPRGKLAHLSYEEADRLTDENTDILWECDYRIRTKTDEIRWVADASVVGYTLTGEQDGAIGILQDITERKQTEQQLRQRLQELAAIHAVSQATASELELDALFEVVSVELLELFDVQEIYFALYNQETDLVEFPYYRHGNQRIATDPIPLGKGLSSRVILSGQPLLINQNYETRSAELGVVRFQVESATISTVSWLGVPIKSGEQVTGMICAINLNRENAFTEADVRLLTTIAANVGISIQNAQLYMDLQKELAERKRAEQELQKSAERLEILHEIDRALLSAHLPEDIASNALVRIRQLIPSQRASITLFDFGKNESTFLATSFTEAYFPLGRSTISLEEYGQYVIDDLLQNKPCRVDDVMNDPRTNELDKMLARAGFNSWLYLPLIYQEQLIGALNIGRNQPFTASDEDIAYEVANQLAIVVQQSRLYKALQVELTERAQTEAALRESEERYRTMVETFPDIIMLTNLRAEILFINSALEQQTGYTLAELQSYRAQNKDFIHPEDVNMVRQAIIELLTSDKDCTDLIENRFIAKDGSVHWYSGIISKVQYKGEQCLQTVTREITSKKQAEARIRELNEELEQRVIERTAQLAAANKELEAFSYSVSHDLRAPLRAINSFTKIISTDFAGTMDPVGRNFLDKVMAAGLKMNQLIDELLDFSRINRKQIEKRDVDMNNIVQAVIESLSPDLENRQIEWVLPKISRARADPTLIYQVFANLIGNAVKYSRGRGTATIEVNEIKEKDQTIYFVRDNGVGFDMNYADKLFGVFQRLHSESEFEGTGIGLATVQRIIARHGGRIWAEAEADKGATFYFTLG